MSLTQFLRILMARRWIIVGLFLGALAIALAVSVVLPERYPARARIMLDVIKPDPVTGSVIATQFVRGYTKTQIELIKDYRVASEVVDDLRQTSDPALVAKWQSATGGNGDLRRWLAQRIIDGTDAKLVEGSNILEISYETTDPAEAKATVASIRDAYIEASLRFRTDSAGRTAEWYRQQAEKAQTALVTAETAKSSFERANGLVMGPGGVDAETSKLQGLQSALLSARGAATAQDFQVAQSANNSAIVDSLKMQISTVDDQIQQAAARLGTAHPTYQGLLQRRTLLQRELAKESAAARANGGTAAQASRRGIADLESQYNAQKARVLGMKEQLDKLGALQREVDLRRAQYEKAASRTSDLTLQADVDETGLVPLGTPVGDSKPSFPNIPLIAVLAALGGLTFGIIAAVVVEMLGRRVRGSEDLVAAARVPVLAVIADRSSAPTGAWFRRLVARRRAANALQPAE